MDSIKKDTLTHSSLSTRGEKLSSEDPKPKVEQIVVKDAGSSKADLETIKNCLSNVKDLKGKKSLMQVINEKFIDQKTLSPLQFKQVYADLKKNKKFKLADSFIAKNLSKSLEKDQMLLSIFRDPTVWTEDFLDNDYGFFLEAIHDTASRDEAYSIIGKHCDNPKLKTEIFQKIQDTNIKDTYILDILEDGLDYEAAIQLAEALSTVESRNQAYAKLAQSNYTADQKIALIRKIEDTELKKEACLSFLNSSDVSVNLQLQAIGLIPDELCSSEGASKDDLRLAIARNPDLSDWDRCQAFCSLESDDRRMETIRGFDQKPSLFSLLVSQAKLRKSLSESLLNFYFLNKDQSLGRSFQDLLQMACNLDTGHAQAYPGSKIAVSDSDAGLISLALNESFSIEDRFIAFQSIQSLEARLDMSELKAFLHIYSSSHTLPESSKLPRFELLSEKDFCSDIGLLLLPDEQQLGKLYKLIQSYHAIPRGVKADFNDRTKLLNEVIASTETILENLTHNPDSARSSLQDQQVQSLQQIKAEAEQKARYLKKVPGLKQKAVERVECLAKPKYTLPTGTPVLNVLGGKIRNLDPLKRKGLGRFRETWEKMVKNDPKTPNFWVWLDTQDVSTIEHDYRYSLFTKEQKRVQFNGNLAYNTVFGDKNDNNRLNGNYIYNIGQDGNLYILYYYTPGNVKLTHDNILKGKNILAAGIVEFKQGKLTYIDVSSGHYAPERFENLQPALAYFSEKHPGVISSDTQIGNYEESHPAFSYAAFKDMKPTKVGKKRETIPFENLGFKSQKPSSLT